MQAEPYITESLQRFSPITLEEMDNVSLMNRKDTKFVFDAGRLPSILDALGDHYCILDINSARSTLYETLYYDTDALQFYLQHHNGKLNRHKLRYRKYSSSDLYYFEVKFKSNKDRTIKKRIKKMTMETVLGNEEAALIGRTIGTVTAEGLKPTLWVFFNRITLVNKSIRERVTFDVGLAYQSFYDTEARVSLPAIVIAEDKQDQFASGSEFMRIMKGERIRSSTFSKYCMGMTLLNRDIKYNRFKQKLITLNKMHHGAVTLS